MNQIQAKKVIESFLLEDIGTGDVSSSIFPPTSIAKGTFIAKAEGVFVGNKIIEWVYECLGANVAIQMFKQDSDMIKKGDIIATVEGSVTALLTGERVILNLIQRMSGIATMTREAVTKLEPDRTKICDTRKTMPGLRMFDKYAVGCGGGYNHRFGLYDAVMLKDNHITHAGSIMRAVNMIRQKVGHMMKVEVEVETKEQVLEAVAAGSDVIMLDNCPPEKIRELIKFIPDTIITEASGGITLSNLSEFRNCGLDYISLGCLTHSVVALDISFNIEGGEKWIF